MTSNVCAKVLHAMTSLNVCQGILVLFRGPLPRSTSGLRNRETTQVQCRSPLFSDSGRGQQAHARLPVWRPPKGGYAREDKGSIDPQGALFLTCRTVCGSVTFRIYAISRPRYESWNRGAVLFGAWIRWRDERLEQPVPFSFQSCVRGKWIPGPSLSRKRRRGSRRRRGRLARRMSSLPQDGTRHIL
jgi:hypothetical protein